METKLEYNDHDLLVLIAERTRVLAENQAKQDAEIHELRVDVDNLKLARASATGFLAGGKFFWAMIVGVLSAPGLIVAVNAVLQSQ